MNDLILITGAAGTGKTTLATLLRMGHDQFNVFDDVVIPHNANYLTSLFGEKLTLKFLRNHDCIICTLNRDNSVFEYLVKHKLPPTLHIEMRGRK